MELRIKGVLQEKSYSFALRIIKRCQALIEQKEFVLSKQLLRSGTAIGALIREAEYAQSDADFIHKFSIALKEASETSYWLSLLKDSGYLTTSEYEALGADCLELIKMLTTAIKTKKGL